MILLDEGEQQANPLGIKGLGELGNVGTHAAVTNAVFHATGTRLRHLLVRIEKLLSPAAWGAACLQPNQVVIP